MATEPRVSAITVANRATGGWLLAVIGKRTYDVRARRCVDAAAQVALVEGPQYSEDAATLLHDSDLIVNRTQTDVIVQGHAYPTPGARTFDVQIGMGSLARTIRVSGDRRLRRTHSGSLAFTEPLAVEKVPLDWTTSYGGVDTAALRKHGDPLQHVCEAMKKPYDPRYGFHAYPRNPLGKGYLTEPTVEAIEACALPNLEEPLRLLTPENIALGEFIQWPKGPPVAATGWLSYNYFPRSTMAGLAPTPYADDIAADHFYEVRLGAVGARSVGMDTEIPQRFDVRIAQASALGMRATDIAPGTAVELVNLHPREPRWRFALPNAPPRMVLRLPGEDAEPVTPHIRTVLLEPDLDRVSVVWIAERVLSAPISAGKFEKTQHAVIWPT